jgi:hypothetical protein
MVRDAAGLLACPLDQPGKDVVTLAEGNAAASKERTGPLSMMDTGRMDTGGAAYKQTPQGIMGNILVGWYITESSAVGKVGVPSTVAPLPITTVLSQVRAQNEALEDLADNGPLDESGVITLRNMAKRRKPGKIESPTSYVEKFGDLYSINRGQESPMRSSGRAEDPSYFLTREGGIISPPSISDGALDFRSVNQLNEEEDHLIWQSMMHSRPTPLTIKLDDDEDYVNPYPCIWVVCKLNSIPNNQQTTIPHESPVTGYENAYFNMATLSEDPDLYRSTDPNGAKGLSIMFGLNPAAIDEGGVTFSSSYLRVHARTSYTEYDRGATGESNVADAYMPYDKIDTSRRVYSVRAERRNLVLKVSDTEYSTEIPLLDDDPTDLYDFLDFRPTTIKIGELLHGEISEVVVTDATPTASQIASLESYFAGKYPDLETTL